MSKAAGVDMKGASDFKLLDRKAVHALLQMPERSVFFRGMSSWIGFRKAEVEFDVREREAGQSKWGIFRLVRYAVRNIAGYSSGTASDGDRRRSAFSSDHSDSGRPDTDQLFQRTGSRRFYNCHIADVIYRKYRHAESRDHRLLYIENLRRDKGTATLRDI